MIEVQSNGAQNIVVDAGRCGFMDIGVARSGAMDSLALRLANAMVGNDATAAGIEVCLFPFRLAFQSDAFVAVVGADCDATLGDSRLPPCWARWARSGETLTLRPPPNGARACIAVAGGIDVPKVLGSRTTELKSGFGGLEGRGLKRGDKLAVANVEPNANGKALRPAAFGIAPEVLTTFWDELACGSVTLRVLPAAEYDEFSAQACDLLTTTPYAVTKESNRTGCRLQGEALTRESSRELMSHGIVPGTVQVPRSGQPIVQLVEANTCGGYPKIATVIEADLWKFGQLTPGTQLRFRIVEVDEAIAALKKMVDELHQLASTLTLLAQCRQESA